MEPFQLQIPAPSAVHIQHGPFRLRIADYQHHSNTVKEIDEEFNIIAEKPYLSDRTSHTVEKPVFIIIKDHNENYHTNTSADPIKTEMGRVSKFMRDRINNDLRSANMV